MRLEASVSYQLPISVQRWSPVGMSGGRVVDHHAGSQAHSGEGAMGTSVRSMAGMSFNSQRQWLGATSAGGTGA